MGIPQRATYKPRRTDRKTFVFLATAEGVAFFESRRLHSTEIRLGHQMNVIYLYIILLSCFLGPCSVMIPLKILHLWSIRWCYKDKKNWGTSSQYGKIQCAVIWTMMWTSRFVKFYHASPLSPPAQTHHKCSLLRRGLVTQTGRLYETERSVNFATQRTLLTRLRSSDLSLSYYH